MAFTFNNYQPSSMNEYPFNDLIGKVLSGYTDMTKARYLQPTLDEELKKTKLYNQYYAPDIESQIGLRKAQTGEAGARTGLIGEQTKGARIENQYLPQKMQTAIAESQANAQKARLLQMIREQLLGGEQLGGMGQDGQIGTQQSMQSPQLGQGAGMFPQGHSTPQQQPQQNPGLGYAQAATAMQLLGLGKPHVVDADGRYMAITPFGNIDTGVHGLTARDTQLSKEDAKKISSLEDIVLKNQGKLDTFNELNEILGSPDFEAIRQLPAAGNLENWMTGKFGTKAQQNLVGRANTLMGNIIKDSARDFAGQFRVGEQALLNGMKPNPGDSLDVMKGKSEALTYLTQMITKRSELEADYMRTYGMSPLQAKIAADKAIDVKAIKEEIRTILHPASSAKPTPEQARAELERRRAARR